MDLQRIYGKKCLKSLISCLKLGLWPGFSCNLEIQNIFPQNSVGRVKDFDVFYTSMFALHRSEVTTIFGYVEVVYNFKGQERKNKEEWKPGIIPSILNEMRHLWRAGVE